MLVKPVQTELTTRQAAEYLNVSRPFLSKVLLKGAIPFRTVGGRRWIKFEDVLKYKKQNEVEQNQALADLVAEAQKLNLGY